METTDVAVEVFASGDRVILRDRVPADADSYVRWQTHGEWRRYDAPWEDFPTTAEAIATFRKRFLETCEQEPPMPRKRATIVTKENKPLGWVSRYGEKKNPHVWLVGIDICRDTCLNRGLGTEALRLWVDYVFAISDVHKLGLDTWSFNPRMIRVAEKVGFAYEGRQREMRQWQGEWLDLLHFGILREEWSGTSKAAGSHA